MRGMVIGRGSFAAFFAVTAAMLPRYGVWLSFACASAISVVVQGATRRMLDSRRPLQAVSRETSLQQPVD
jgi:membrane protein implicated in regulation of membrane protease activity